MPEEGHMTGKRIGLFGNFGGGNLGNDGSLEAMLLFLRQSYPNADMVCICAEPDVISKQFDIPTLPAYAPRPHNRGTLDKVRGKIADHIGVVRNVRNLDVLLIPGTGILDDFGERPIGFPYIIFLICLAAKLRGIKVAFVSTGAGPIVHPLSRFFMKTAARTAVYRSYRDQISKDFMESIGIDISNDPIYPDLAFRLPDPVPAERPKDNTLTIGLGVMEYYGWTAAGGQDIYDGYIRKLTQFAIWLLNHGYRIRLLVGQDCDQRAVDDLTNAVKAELGDITAESMVAQMPHSLNDLMEQISSVDAVVATRFHNVLCALKVGRPTISLGYAKKNDVLMADMGLGEFCQHIERLDVDMLIQQFQKLIEQRTAYQEIVKANGASLRQKLEQQEQSLITHII
jgi:polysaccharide pyruvyl transferase WcaK-like protein